MPHLPMSAATAALNHRQKSQAFPPLNVPTKPSPAPAPDGTPSPPTIARTRRTAPRTLRCVARKTLSTVSPPSPLVHSKGAAGSVSSSVKQQVWPAGAFQRAVGRTSTRQFSKSGNNCYDNAAMASWNRSLKVEAVHRGRFEMRADARANVFDYIEVAYHRNRLHSTLGYLSPRQFEPAHIA